ncbi:DNA polymerase III subunit gamma/tau [Variovorax sp. RT4R15]|uniref:DNA polymerase III subunit gamma/tau n=1 Tax=Variovorax sp. RT4R15 TaxID=3443737 RepID=UPI003F467473
MSYLVLARKYRPRNFEEMVGQEHVVQALSNALTTQRLHHAYLFTGTRGVGKTTVSRILAKSLNCQGPDGQGGITATPCGVCQACKDIDSGRFVDYTELDAASNRGVDEVQSLLEQAVYKPVQGRFKVFMIDEVHMLTNTAFNAMLKTLEEPPEYLKFVLATTDPQKVPVTVLSRCLQFNLRPMAPETVLEHLTHVLQTEQVPAEPLALKLLARAARGSMRDALSLTDQAIAFGNGTLVEGGVRQMLGTVDRGHVFGLIEALAAGDGKTVVETSEALRRDGLSAASTLEEMTSVLQAMAVLQAVPSRAEAALDTTDPDAAETARLAVRMPADETQLLYSLCLHGRGELGLAPDEYAGLTMVLLRLLAFKPNPEKKTLSEPVRAAAPAVERQALPAAPVTFPVVAAVAAPVAPVAPPPGHRLTVVEPPALAGSEPRRPAAPVAPAQDAAKVVAMQVRVQPPPGARDAARSDEPGAPIVPSEDGDFWHETVTQLVLAEAISALARELALQSQLVARDVDQWLLRVERESLNQAASREKLQTALVTLGHGVKLAIEIGSVVDSPARRNKLAAEARQRAAEEAIHNDPLVQSMMRDFDARIVPGTLRPV